MMGITQRSVLRLVSRQHGVIAHRQLVREGFTDRMIEHLAANGWLHPVFRAVYAVGRPDLTERGRWMAAVLACGEDSAVSHFSAAALWGIRPHSSAIVDVSFPGAEHRHPGIRPHRRTPMPSITLVDGIPATTPEWTLVDLAAHLKLEPLTRTANEADKLGILDHDKFISLVESLKGRRGIKKLRLLLHLDRTDSNLERRMLALLDKAGLPKPLTQQLIEGMRVDFLWPASKVVVETDGLTYHRTPAEQAADRKRDQILTRNGFTVLRFTNAQVRLEPHDVLRTMRALLQQG